MAARTSRAPVRVGLRPTPATVTRASFTIAAAIRGKAADEMSPGTTTGAADNGPGVSVVVRPRLSMRAPNWRNITSE